MAEHIVIGDVRPRVQYVADGSQTVFFYAFPIFAAGDLEVRIDRHVSTIAFTVTGAGGSQGGSLVFEHAPPRGALVTLRRRMAIARRTDFQENGLLRARTLNDELDYGTAGLQQIAEDAARTIRLDPADPGEGLVLPDAGTRAGRLLAFDDQGRVTLLRPGVGEVGSYQAPGSGAATRTAQDKLRELSLSVRDFGARGDGITDDRAAIQAAFDEAALSGRRVDIPEGEYRIEGGIVLPAAAAGLSMRGRIVMAGQGTALTIGAPGQVRLFHKRITGIRVARATQGDWSSETEIGVRLFNLYASEIEIREVRGFTIGVQCFGDGTGFVFNRVALGRIADGRIGLDLRSGEGGWNNQNVFQGGSIGCGSTVNVALSRFGVRFSRTEAGYDIHNCNTFVGLSFELRGVREWGAGEPYTAGTRAKSDGGRVYTCTTGGVSGTTPPAGTGSAISDGGCVWSFTQPSHDSIPVLMEVSGRSNQFLGCRNESNGRIVARETGEAAQHNLYEFANVAGNGPLSSIGTPNSYRVEHLGSRACSLLRIGNGIDRFWAADQPMKLIAASTDLRSLANPFDATRTYVQGMSQVGTQPMRPERARCTFRALSNFAITSQGVRILQPSRALGWCVDTSRVKRFLLSYALAVEEKAGRVLVRCFDAADRLIATGQPLRGSESLVWNPDLQGFRTDEDGFAPLYFEVEDGVETIWVGIAGGTLVPELTAMRLYTPDGWAPRVFAGHADDAPSGEALAIEAPSTGSWQAGAALRNADPSRGGPDSWLCLRAGTFGSAGSVQAVALAGQPLAWALPPGPGPIQPGDVVGVAGAIASATVASVVSMQQAASSAWSPSTAYVAGDEVRNGSAWFVCVQAGTSAVAGGPAGTGTSIVDGTARWAQVTARLTLGQNATASVTGAAVAFVAPLFVPRPGPAGERAWDVPSLAAGASSATTVTVPGARQGSFAVAALDTAPAGLVLSATVSAADSVSVTATNATGAGVDPLPGRLRVQVMQA